jgi:zinc transport system substrate-binding protein
VGILLAWGSACGNSGGGSGGRRTVVASFYPLEEAARQVGGSRFEVEDLTPPGVEPHDLELSPNQIDEILDAEVLLYLGSGFQPAVEDAARNRDSGKVTVDLLQRIGTRLRPGSAGEPADPHVWQDPTLMRRIVDATAVALGRADPGHSSEYRSNAAAYDERLASLDREYREGLAQCRSTVLVTNHAAFGYMADRYGLRQEPITGISPEAEPDPARLAQIEDLVRRDHVTTIFTETLVSPRVADTIARETGATTAVLDPLEGLTPQERAAGDDYVSVMERNLAAIRKGLGCE